MHAITKAAPNIIGDRSAIEMAALVTPAVAVPVPKMEHCSTLKVPHARVLKLLQTELAALAGSVVVAPRTTVVPPLGADIVTPPKPPVVLPWRAASHARMSAAQLE